MDMYRAAQQVIAQILKRLNELESEITNPLTVINEPEIEKNRIKIE